MAGSGSDKEDGAAGVACPLCGQCFPQEELEAHVISELAAREKDTGLSGITPPSGPRGRIGPSPNKGGAHGSVSGSEEEEEEEDGAPPEGSSLAVYDQNHGQKGDSSPSAPVAPPPLPNADYETDEDTRDLLQQLVMEGIAGDDDDEADDLAAHKHGKSPRGPPALAPGEDFEMEDLGGGGPTPVVRSVYPARGVVEDDSELFDMPPNGFDQPVFVVPHGFAATVSPAYGAAAPYVARSPGTTQTQDETFSDYYQRMFGSAPPPGMEGAPGTLHMDFSEPSPPGGVTGKADLFHFRHHMRTEGKRRRCLRCALITPLLCCPLVLLVLGIVFVAPRDPYFDQRDGELVTYVKSGSSSIKYDLTWKIRVKNNCFFPMYIYRVSCNLYHYYYLDAQGYFTSYIIKKVTDSDSHMYQGQDETFLHMRGEGTAINDGDTDAAPYWMVRTWDDQQTHEKWGVICIVSHSYLGIQDTSYLDLATWEHQFRT